MTHRKIKDGHGRRWDVWEVYPSAVERRMSGESPAVQNTDGSSAERHQVKILVPSALQQGWLAFQAGDDRRRLAPIPLNWSTLDEETLVVLLGRADRLTNSDAK